MIPSVFPSAIPVDVLARAPLLPVLLAQAISVRRKAMSLPEPPGARNGNAGSGPPLRLLIAGDSSAAGVGAASQKQALSGQLVSALAQHYHVTWRLAAKTGATTKSTLASLAQFTPERFDVVVTALGVNDVTRVVSRRRWIARQQTLHQLFRDRFGATRIFASGLPPVGLFPLLPQPLRWMLGQHATRLDTALADITAQTPDLRHIPFNFPHDPAYVAQDGFHPSPLAYSHWATELARRIVADPVGSKP